MHTPRKQESVLAKVFEIKTKKQILCMAFWNKFTAVPSISWGFSYWRCCTYRALSYWSDIREADAITEQVTAH